MLLAIAAVCAIFGAALGLMQSMGISVQTITAVLASYVDGTVCLAHPRDLRAHRGDILRYHSAYHGTQGILIQAPFISLHRRVATIPLSWKR